MAHEDKTRQELASELEELPQKIAGSSSFKGIYELLAKESRDTILFVSRDTGRILEANAAATTSYGYSREELLRLSDYDLRAPDTRMLTDKQIEEADRHGILFETVHRRKDGSTFPVEVSSRGASIHGERILINVIRNITARKDAEKTENRLAAIVEDSDDAIMAATLDGTITNWNRGAEVIYGYHADEAIGESISMLIPPTRTDEMPTILKRIGQGERIFNYETKRRRRDGRTISVALTVSPIKDASGSIVGASAIARDITAKKQAEDALRKSEDHYRSLFENMLEGFAHCKMIFENDQPVDFEYLAVNRAFEILTGLRNVVGRKVTEVIPGIRESNPEVFEMYGRVAMTGVPERFETYVPELGIWFVISVYSREKGSFVAIFDNVTARKKAEADLKSVNEQLERRVAERTSELRAKSINLEEVNTALRVLLGRIEEDRKELEEAIAGNLRSLILPYIEKLQKTRLSADQATYLSILQSHLSQIESRFVRKLSLQHMGLTPTELQVAVLIRDGKSTKEIAEIMRVSEKGVGFHRENLRRKLNIAHKRENLRSHLIALI